MRNTITTSADILRQVDLLNGAGAFEPRNGVALGAQPQQGPCTIGRKYVYANKLDAATGSSASIRTRNTVLCGEPTSTIVAASAVWTGVTKYVGQTPEKWAQIGYFRRRDTGSTTATTRQYAETKAGPNMPADYNIFSSPDPLPTGIHEYRCSLLSPLFGTWTYEIDGLPFHTYTHNGWRNVTGTQYQWVAEIFNREDQMVGTSSAKCDITDCQVSLNWTSFQSANIVATDLKNSNSNEWGIERVSATALNVWDKVLP